MQGGKIKNILTVPPVSPYREFSISIPPNGSVVLNYLTNTFRALLLSQNSLSIAFIDGQKTTYAGVGVGLIFPADQVYPSVKLYNTDTVNTLTGTIAVGVMSAIEDTRSAVQTGVTVLPQTTLITAADVAIAAATAVKVYAANVLTKNVTVSNLLANNTTVRYGDSFVGAARGAELGIGASAIITNTADIWVYNPSGAGINIGIASEQ